MTDHSCNVCRRWFAQGVRKDCYVCGGKFFEPTESPVCDRCWRNHVQHAKQRTKAVSQPLNAARFAWNIEE